MRLIDADALMKLARNNINKTVNCNEIAWFPTIEAEPVRHGKWIATSWRTKCSLCGFAGSIYDQPVNPFKYCPHCGAKMDGG